MHDIIQRYACPVNAPEKEVVAVKHFFFMPNNSSVQMIQGLTQNYYLWWLLSLARLRMSIL